MTAPSDVPTARARAALPLRAASIGQLALEAAPYVVLLGLCALAFHHTVDDAFISFRYARNFARGLGLVYNPGERVEGYSNPLWVYLLAPAAWLGLDLALVAKLFGIGAAGVLLYLFSRISERHFGIGRGIRQTALLFLAGHISLIYYAVAGLETVLYACLVLLLHYALLEQRRVLAATAVGLAAICRPEGAVLLGPLVLGIGASRGPRGKWLCLLVPLALLGAELAFRRSYYGAWLPNTFHAKAVSKLPLHELLWEHMICFWYSARVWLWDHFAFGALSVPAVAGMLLYRRVHPPMLASIAVLLAFVGYAKFDWMAFGRFYLPLLPLLSLYAFAAISGWSAQYVQSRQWLWVGGSALAVALVGLSVATSVRSLAQLRAAATYDPAMSVQRHYDAANYIRARSAPGDLLAAPEIGLLAYLTELYTIDMFGLTDRHVPTLLGPPDRWEHLSQPQLEKYAEYILARSPRFVVLNLEAEAPDRLEPQMRSLYDRMMALGGYSLRKTYWLSPDRDLAIFMRER